MPSVIKEEIVVGSAEWHALNNRRAALIEKKYAPGQGLTADEKVEYERLQEVCRAAMDRAFPRPRMDPEDLAIVKKDLGLIKDEGGK